MSEAGGTRDGILRIDESGLIVSANDSAEHLFAGNPTGGTLSERLLRSGGSGEWTTLDGQRFKAETFSIRPDEGSLEIRLRLTDPDDDTISRRKKDSLLQISADVFRAGPADLDRTIVDALGRIGHLTGADRAYLFMMTEDRDARNTHEWSRSGTSPQVDKLRVIPHEEFAWFEKRLTRDECLIIPSVAELPRSLDDVRNHLEDQGIQSLLSIGIFEDGDLVGLAGFDACRREARWSPRSVERTRLIAELFVQSILRARASHELERTKELFDLVRTATSDVIYDWNVQDGSVRRQGLEAFVGGISLEASPTAEWWFDQIHSEEREAVRTSYDEALSDPTIHTHSAEFRVSRADGEWAYVLDRSFIVRDSSGRAVRVIGSTSDLTVRVRAEEQLRKQQELFHYVRLATNDIIWDIDLEGGRAWRSESIESVLGIPPSPDQHIEWWMGRVHPDDREHSRVELEKLLADPKRTFLEHTYRMRHSDGSWVSILDRGYVIRDENGRAIRMIGTCTDVTEQQRALRRLKESEARFKAVVENVSDVIAIVDRNGIVVYESPASSGVFGFSPKELVGKSMFHHVHADDRRRVELLFRDALAANAREARATFRYQHASGHWLTVETVGANFIDREQIGGIVLVSRDITQRRHTEQQLERSTRLASLGHLASSMAHEFNNVLMGAQPFVEVIRRKTADEQLQVAASRIAEALDKGKETSRALLGFVRPFSVSLETIDLRGWIRGIEDEIRSIVPDNIHMTLKVSDRSLKVTADPMGLHQSLLNLVLNASEVLQHRDSGEIMLAVMPAVSAEGVGRDDYIVISVSDNGPQLSPEALEHIFDPMFTTRRAKNAGLELAVVHQLITAQSGKVKAESTPEGTTYSIYLRASEPSGDHYGRETFESASSEDLILLVEDNAIVASGIAAVLELEDQRVEVVGTGEEAIARVRAARPSVLILDIGLPDMSGIEVYENIAKDYPDLPVIFSSGHGDQQELKRFLHRPNVEFLLKPYDAQTLMSIVERLRQGTN